MRLVEKREHFFGKNEWVDLATRLALRPLMLAAASGKKSHWFDWGMIEKPNSFSGGLVLPGDLNAFETHNILDEIRMSLGGWERGYLIGPDSEEVDAEELVDGFYYGYRDRSHKVNRDAESGGRQFINVCYLVLRDPTIVLAGPHDLEVYGLHPETMSEIPIRAYSTLIPRRLSIV